MPATGRSPIIKFGKVQSSQHLRLMVVWSAEQCYD